jgi:hypothetical protein
MGGAKSSGARVPRRRTCVAALSSAIRFLALRVEPQTELGNFRVLQLGPHLGAAIDVDVEETAQLLVTGSPAPK